ncbi:site-specific integrase [Paenibacillus sp. 19GGS1-52]|uniref:site-specific integrase n=1 Tax=Paenibacillus sp. 19GGS1-52 TaxID=2758563 RepID=UPI001EFBDDE8|nr:tyrosine-type recombinase/integrase [Paenibacillus sp. 19GGS1-52]ULO05172.1 site-specific integrase [Paenibacillus sp. 19GGS1-52]
MASIQKRGENRWRLVAELGYDAQGKRVQERKTIIVDDPSLLRAPRRLQNYLDAELLKFQMEVEAGHYIRPEKLTFEAFIEIWINKFVEVELQEKTKVSYKFHAERRIVPFFRTMHMDKIKTMHITDYLDYLRTPEASLNRDGKPLGSATIVYNYRVLRSIFAKAVEWRVLKDNPMTGVKKPREDDIKEMEYYDEKEIELLFMALEDEPIQLRLQVTLAVTTGMRRAEMAGLEWKNIDLVNGVIDIKQTVTMFKDGAPVIKGPKNKQSKRRIALAPAVIDEMKLYRTEWAKMKLQLGDKWTAGDSEFLFCRTSGEPSDPERLTKRWISFHRKHDLKPIRLHDLRHTSVSWMVFKKVHSEAIAKRVGHTNTKMLQIYAHIFDSVDQAAADVFDGMVIPAKKKA